MSVGIHLNLSTANKSDWEWGKKCAGQCAASPIRCQPCSLGGTDPVPISVDGPSFPPRLKPRRFRCLYWGPSGVKWSYLRWCVWDFPLSRKHVAPAAAGGHPTNLREAIVQAKPRPRGEQDLEDGRGAALPLPDLKAFLLSERIMQEVGLRFLGFFFFLNDVTYNCKDPWYREISLIAFHWQIVPEIERSVREGEGMCLTSLLRDKNLRKRSRKQDGSWKQAV